jgi:hypothetical protein
MIFQILSIFKLRPFTIDEAAEHFRYPRRRLCNIIASDTEGGTVLSSPTEDQNDENTGSAGTPYDRRP